MKRYLDEELTANVVFLKYWLENEPDQILICYYFDNCRSISL